MDTGLKPLEFWGGIECSNVRLSSRRVDQLAWLTIEPETLVDLVASLGVRRVRFPIVWERIVPCIGARPDWSWTDRAIGRLQEHGIEPIAGLVHHGSGPDGTDLLDPAFSEKFAAYAQAVARRYPWITAYTPINEPLTTARFGALYGIWYPHRSDPVSFAHALYNQCAAVRQAMDAIRAVVPSAVLVQTEDLAKVHATGHMAYQAATENLRRWAAIDILAGSGARNPVAVELAERIGIDDLTPYICVPDIVGFNYYVTSERFLDERVERYPRETIGTNGIDSYADVTAARACVEGGAGLDVLLGEAAERFAIPLAVSEAHLGCTREEQLRWLDETLAATHRARERGCDVRAFTFWSLFGAREWNSLLRRADGFYETGAYDARVQPPRATAVARFIETTTAGTPFTHPAAAGPGWWRAPHRFEHPPAVRGDACSDSREHSAARAPILIAGPDAAAYAAFVHACRLRSLDALALGRDGCDTADRESIERAIVALKPWAMVLCIAAQRADDAERHALAVVRAADRYDIAAVVVGGERVHALAGLVPDALTIGSELQGEANAHAVLDLLVDGERGWWRIATDGTPSNARHTAAETARESVAAIA